MGELVGLGLSHVDLAFYAEETVQMMLILIMIAKNLSVIPRVTFYF